MGSSPARLVIALSVAAALAIFVVYTALAGNGVADLTPSSLAGHTGNVSLIGKVVVLACLDNLVKGAAGVAVQNLNLVIGCPETTALL